MISHHNESTLNQIDHLTKSLSKRTNDLLISEKQTQALLKKISELRKQLNDMVNNPSVYTNIHQQRMKIISKMVNQYYPKIIIDPQVDINDLKW